MHLGLALKLKVKVTKCQDFVLSLSSMNPAHTFTALDTNRNVDKLDSNT